MVSMRRALVLFFLVGCGGSSSAVDAGFDGGDAQAVVDVLPAIDTMTAAPTVVDASTAVPVNSDAYQPPVPVVDARQAPDVAQPVDALPAIDLRQLPDLRVEQPVDARVPDPVDTRPAVDLAPAVDTRPATSTCAASVPIRGNCQLEWCQLNGTIYDATTCAACGGPGQPCCTDQSAACRCNTACDSATHTCKWARLGCE